jgi:hypothetical protein
MDALATDAGPAAPVIKTQKNKLTGPPPAGSSLQGGRPFGLRAIVVGLASSAGSFGRRRDLYSVSVKSR